MNDLAEEPARETWIVTGLMALAQGGVDAVKVERLASTLGVSKRPFYWRFKDRQALLSDMLEYWRSDQTERLIREVSVHASARSRLEALTELALDEHSGGLNVSGVEGAVRAWAAQDASAAALVDQVDRARVDYLARELRALGATKKSAGALAKGVYLTLIGLYAARRYTPELASDDAFRAIVRTVLDGVVDQTTARAGR